MAKKTAKKPAKAKKPAAKKPAAKKAVAKKPAPRYKATPADVSDRQHLVNVIQEKTGCTATAAREAMTALLGTMGTSLKKNQKVSLPGFGTFNVVKRAARKGRNPQTGEAIRIRASKGVRFKAGQTLKGSL